MVFLVDAVFKMEEFKVIVLRKVADVNGRLSHCFIVGCLQNTEADGRKMSMFIFKVIL